MSNKFWIKAFLCQYLLVGQTTISSDQVNSIMGKNLVSCLVYIWFTISWHQSESIISLTTKWLCQKNPFDTPMTVVCHLIARIFIMLTLLMPIFVYPLKLHYMTSIVSFVVTSCLQCGLDSDVIIYHIVGSACYTNALRKQQKL